MPGFAFAGTLYQVQDKEEYKDVKFIALDVSEYDLFDCFYKHDETGARAGLIDENNKEHISENVYCAVYKEELCGYMAGYAAVKLGYTHLGFLGGMAVPAVIRYGYGFVQGCNDAGKEMNDEITVEYVYGNKFAGTPEITAYMDTWYQERAFRLCSHAAAASTPPQPKLQKKANGKVIGVDTDQAATINKLGTEAHDRYLRNEAVSAQPSRQPSKTLSKTAIGLTTAARSQPSASYPATIPNLTTFRSPPGIHSVDGHLHKGRL